MSDNDEARRNLSRRQALKFLTAVTGATALSQLPNKWSKPLLKVGVLPAHAQTSPVPTATATSTPTSTPTATATATPTLIQGSIEAEVDWSFEVGEIDLDLEVFDPGDSTWATPNNLATLTLLHGGGSPLNGLGNERVDSQGSVAVGTYQVRLQVVSTNSSQGFLLFAEIFLTTSTTATESRTIMFDAPPPADGTIIDVATVDFPSGAINWLIP